MKIEKFEPFIENKLQAEPWRGAVGKGPLCNGKIEWDGTRFWLCQGCGKIGTATVQIHRQVKSPTHTISKAIARVLLAKR